MQKEELNIIKKLNGFSGCDIYLMKKEETYFVKKISQSLNYNKRLITQKEKQEEAYDLFNGYGVYIPKILDYGYENNLYYFSMEYIKGQTAIAYLVNSSLKNTVELIERLIYILKLFEKTEIDITNNQLFTKKIFQKINGVLNVTNISKDTKLKIYNSLEKVLTYDDIIKPSYCHGDFTLENIIIDEKNNIWIIDFLDSFYQSMYFDIAKLYQDIEGEWYNIKNVNVNLPDIKRIYVYKLFDNYIKNEFNDYSQIHYFLLMLNFLRIVPYAKNEEIKMRLEYKVEIYINKFIQSKGVL